MHIICTGILYMCSFLFILQKNNMGTSLIEAFTVDQIEDHLHSTFNCFANAKPPKEKDLMHYNPEDACAICKQYHLNFEPPSIWCSICAKKIQKG